jgi:hypothetical protein
MDAAQHKMTASKRSPDRCDSLLARKQSRDERGQHGECLVTFLNELTPSQSRARTQRGLENRTPSSTVHWTPARLARLPFASGVRPPAGPDATAREALAVPVGMRFMLLGPA